MLGCGWLGFPLAKALVNDGYQLRGSTTTESKLKQLESNHIESFKITLNNQGVLGQIDAFVKNAAIIIIAIPPGLRRDPENNLLAQLQEITPHFKKAGVNHVIFISSTSVYNNTKTINTINEQTALCPETASGKMIAHIEAFLQSQSEFTTTIVRCSGLFNDTRHPAKSLSGKCNLKQADGPVNLVHQLDVIAIIRALLKTNKFGDSYNLAYPAHPTRKEYYTKKCKSLGLPPPHFINTESSLGKIINSEKIISTLNYKFQHPI